jgi:hypothetical protein
MESVLAAGLLRHAASAIRNGVDVDTALREAPRGASKCVQKPILERISNAIPGKTKANVTPEVIRGAIKPPVPLSPARHSTETEKEA